MKQEDIKQRLCSVSLIDVEAVKDIVIEEGFEATSINQIARVIASQDKVAKRVNYWLFD